ncbi:MAG: DUF2262 domain-containing protein [Planctomycetaceae bacterium]|nr:DUF2262 domain-containing protein [Planctomycetaceae bacterium]
MATSRDELIDQLKAQPLVDLTGVVGASGSGGGRSRGEELWSFTFVLVAWRSNGGTINDSELIVRRLATQAELKALQKQINANMVVRLKARIAMENVYGRPEALLESIDEERHDDAELNARLDELLKPVVRSDQKFGDFLLDRSVTTFSTETEWVGETVELCLWLDKIEEFDRAARVAHALWDDSLKWNELVLDCLARDVLRLKSENWQEEDGSTVTREQFESRISLNRIEVRPDGHFEFWYDDDELFWGHDIAAMGKIDSSELSGGIHG